MENNLITLISHKAIRKMSSLIFVNLVCFFLCILVFNYLCLNKQTNKLINKKVSEKEILSASWVAPRSLDPLQCNSGRFWGHLNQP